ncbi:MAG: DUF4126 domain-containing protein [Nocardioidaceae bacterium]
MELLPMVFSSGWASGINAYAVVLLMGLLGRFADVDSVPEALTRVDVMVVAAVMFGVEFVADKIPYVDSGWDAISTAIRPTVGAALGLLIAGDASSVEQATLAAVGGGTALVSHLVKGGLRLAVNGSPEPASNVAVSVGEDVSVAGVVLLAVSYPWAAAAIATVLLVAGLVLLFYVGRRVRRGWRRWKGREPRAVAG